jgi:hypothetical protein
MFRCPEGWACVEVQDSLAFNVPGVDNFARAMLSMFQCVTLSAWSYMQARLTLCNVAQNWSSLMQTNR